MTKRSLLDETDLEILSYLSENARVSNRDIAQKVGVAEATFRARVKRMLDEKFIRFTALTREVDMETPTLCYVGLRVDLSNLTEVAEALSEFQEVRFVASTLGRFDIFAVVVVSSVEGLHRFISDKVISIPGVRRVNTSITTRTLKYDHRWGKVD